MDPIEMPISCANSTMVILRSHSISCRTFSIIPAVLDIEGLPLRWSFSNFTCPLLNRETSRKLRISLVLYHRKLAAGPIVSLKQIFPTCT
jgi:hypothetical protein